MSQVQRPVEDLGFQAFLFLSRLDDLLVHLLKHARHGGHHRGMDLFQVGGDGGQALCVVDRHAKELIEVDQHTLVGVADGEEAEGDLGPLRRGVLQVIELMHDVSVGEHDALRGSRGAGGVEDRGAVGGTDGVHALLDFFLVGMLRAQGDQLLEVRIFLAVDEGVEVFKFGDLGADLLDLVHDDSAFHDDHPGIAVVEDVTVVLLADGGVDGHSDAADHHDGHVEDVPLRTVAADERHLVAGLDAEFDEGVTDFPSQVLIFLWTVFSPTSVFFSR